MKSFNWIHLSDLHYGLKGQAVAWPNIRQSFWDDLAKIHEKTGPWNAVLFSGDLVQSGKKDEFLALEDKVLGPLWEHMSGLGSKDVVLLPVPGNHDLTRPETSRPSASMRQLLRPDGFAEIGDEFWTDPECCYRKDIAAAFEAYQEWFNSNHRNKGVSIRQGALPGDYVATINIHPNTNESLKIGVAGINSTFLQLAAGDYTRRLNIDARQLHSACGEDLPSWVKSHDACILMTHQGPAWFDTTSLSIAYSEINPAGRFAVHLFGHMHEIAVRTESFGGGACNRQWQGNSLFSREPVAGSASLERRHGYAAGMIQFSNQGAFIRYWPRKAVHDASNGWRFTPDHERCILEEDDGTKPEYCGAQVGTTAAKSDALGLDLETRAKTLQEMELSLQHALEAFKGQPTVFIEPKLSKKREFNDDPNELYTLLANPRDTIVLAPPEFGLTCLGLYLQAEAYRNNKLWLYIDAESTKGRKLADILDEKILHYGHLLSDLKCVIFDGWVPENLDHLTMVKVIEEKCQGLPVILLAEDIPFSEASQNLAKLKRSFEVIHLQALSRGAMRQLVERYNAAKRIGTDDVLLAGVAEHMEAINIHRTPLNCYTLLRVLDSSYGEKLVNKSKLLKAILFILFTDHSSFSFLSNKPEVDECTFVLGQFCKSLLMQGTRQFAYSDLLTNLRDVCKSRCMVLNVEAMLNVLIDNNILLRRGERMEFRHKFWIYYFAAEWMQHDNDFREYILRNRNYANYPEIIELYSGVDGKRSDALEAVCTDLLQLIEAVETKIGIPRGFDPLSTLLWNPTNEFIQKARNQIAEKVESSNLPSNIKDKHADKYYNSEAPYDQSIKKFLTDYSVLTLLGSIKAASRALRSSHFVDIKLKQRVAAAIFQGWEEVSRVIFWISPVLAKNGQAVHDGFALKLDDGFSENLDRRFKEILTANPQNIVDLLGDDLASRKLGPLVDQCLSGSGSLLQRHMIALFIIAVRPEGWKDTAMMHINLLHPRSFYLGDVFARLAEEITLGDLEHEEEFGLKQLAKAVCSKREYAPNVFDDKPLTHGQILNEQNKLPYDKLMKGNHANFYLNNSKR